MKNFFKKLSFVMAAAMVISSLYAPAAKAAAKDSITLKGKAISKKSIFVGGEKVNFDYKIGKFNNKGADGKWSTSDTSIITVNKHGVVTAVGTGDATLMLKVKKNTKKGIKKNLTFKVKLTAFARASKLEIPASDKAISLKVGETKDIIPTLTNKVDGVDHTYNLFAKSSDDSVAKAKVVDNSKVVVEPIMPSATPATITVFAAQKNSADEAFDNKYKVEDSFTVKVVANLEAKQSGAKTIKVSGADLSTDAAMYVLKNANKLGVNLKSVTVNTEKTEAVLEAYNLPVGKYTVVYNKDTELEVDVVKAVVASIEISPEDKLIKTGDTTGYVNYKVVDQFGNDITNTNIPDIHPSASLGTPDVKKATKKVEFTGLTNVVVNLTKVNLTLVDKNTGVNKTALLTFSDVGKVWSAEFKGIYDIKEKKIVESFKEDAKYTNSSNDDVFDNFLLLVEAKDQYGNVYTDHTKAADVNVVLSSTTNLKTIADITATTEVNGVKYLTYKLATPKDVRAVAGSVDVIGIIVNNGTKVSGKFEVLPTQKIDNIDIMAPAAGIMNKEENVLPYTATDVDGNSVTDFEMLKHFNNTSKMSTYVAGTFRFEKGDDGKAVLKYKPSATGIVPVTVTSQTNKVKTILLTVKEERKPVSIKALASDIVTGATRNNDIQIPLNKLVFVDQYGTDLTAKQIQEIHGDNKFSIKAKVTTEGFTNGEKFSFVAPSNGSEATIAIQSDKLQDDDYVINVNALPNGTTETAPKAKTNYKVDVLLTLVDVDATKDLDKNGVVLHNVDLDTVTDIKFETIALAPAPDLYKTDKYDVEPKVTGKSSTGNIALKVGVDYLVLDGVGSDGSVASAVADNKFVNIPKKGAETKQGGELAAKVMVLTEKPMTLEQVVKYSFENLKVQEVALKKEANKEFSVADNATAFKFANIFAQLDVKDQYGRTIQAEDVDADDKRANLHPTVVFSNYDSTKFTVTKNGTKDAQIIVADAAGTENHEGTVTLIFPVTNKKLEFKFKLKKNS